MYSSGIWTIRPTTSPLSAGRPKIPSPTGRELATAGIRYLAGIKSGRGFLPELSWSHYRALMRVEDRTARDFYAREPAESGWSKAQLEPGLFKKVTGLTVKDFELLVSLGVFNSALMNDAVYKFKRYEDASLSYTGIDKHEGEDIGLYDTVITQTDALKLFENMPAGAKYAK